MRKEKMKNGIMSLLIAACMFMQLIPMANHAMAAEPAEQTINFLESGYNYDTATLANSGWEVDRENSTVITDQVGGNNIRAGVGADYRAWSAGQTLTFNFNIKADGYYKVSAVPALIFGPVDGCVADILVDDIKVGSINWAVDASGDAAYPTIEMDGVYLAADATHRLTIKRTNESGGEYADIQSVTFTSAEEPAEQTIHFAASGYDYSTATLANSGWEVNREKSTVITDGVSLNDIRESSGNKYAGYRAWFAGQTLTFNFNIKADGYYKVTAVPALLFGAADGCVADILIDDIKVGSIDWAVNASGDAQYPTVEMDSVYLAANATHRLTIRRSNESGGEYGGIRSITFTPAEEPAEQSIHFGASGYNYSTATLANSGWEVNLNKSSVIADGISLNDIRDHSGNKYAGYHTWGAGYTLTFNFNIKADGYYKVTAVPALLFGAADGCVADILIDDIKVGSIDWAVNASGDAQYPTVELEGAYLDAESVHTFTIKQTNATGGVYGGIQSITFAPADLPASEIFGDTYAYVKDGTVYFIGGLKKIEGYSEVGFEVWVNGTQADDIKTSEVYTSFEVGNQTVNAEDWDAEYIFITDKSGLNAGDKVVIKPYIANGDEKTYHADAFALKLAI